MYHCVTSKFGLSRAAFYGKREGDCIVFTHFDELHVSRLPPEDTTVPCSKSHYIGTVHDIPAAAEPLNVLNGAVMLRYREDFEYALRPAFLSWHELDFSPLVARRLLDLDTRFTAMMHEKYNQIHESIVELFAIGGITSLHIGDASIHRGNNLELNIGISGELVEAITGQFKYEGK
jgi:hypothetical protein